MMQPVRLVPASTFPTDLAPTRPLTPWQLEAIEERARSVGHASCIHLPTLRAVAREDVPALLAEIHRLRALLG